MKLALALVVSAASLLAACSSTPVAEPAPETKAAAPAAPAAPAQSSSTGAAAPAAQALPAHLDPNSALSKQHSVYFDFDVYTIKPEFNSVLELHAAYLKAHPELHVRLEGNADERGGREYNLALGQKRSEAVKRALNTLGATDKQEEAVSFGKEKPKALGHDEAAWAENRRVDIVYVQGK